MIKISENELNEFRHLFDQRPIKNNVGGMSAEAWFWIWRTLRETSDVMHVIESGVWRGNTTWLIVNARPDVTVDCCDPIACYLPPLIKTADIRVQHALRNDFGATQYIIDAVNSDWDYWWAWNHRPPQVQKTGHDIMEFQPRRPTRGWGTTLAIFDDHKDVLPRLRRCVELGIKHVLLDDQHHDSTSFKTIFSYKNPGAKNVSVTDADVKDFADFERHSVVAYNEFEHLDDDFFKPFERHQCLTRITLKTGLE